MTGGPSGEHGSLETVLSWPDTLKFGYTFLILGLLNHVTCTCMNLRAICKLTLITDLGDFPFHSVFCGNKQPENRNCNFVVLFAFQWILLIHRFLVDPAPQSLSSEFQVLYFVCKALHFIFKLWPSWFKAFLKLDTLYCWSWAIFLVAVRLNPCAFHILVCYKLHVLLRICNSTLIQYGCEIFYFISFHIDLFILGDVCTHVRETNWDREKQTQQNREWGCML